MTDILEECEDGRFIFWCPGCETYHFFKTTGDGPCWQWDGNMESPTVTPSIRVQSTYGSKQEKRCCHFFMKSGVLEYLNDCTHRLAGRKIPMMVNE